MIEIGHLKVTVCNFSEAQVASVYRFLRIRRVCVTEELLWFVLQWKMERCLTSGA